jgi:hypothetical protein
MEVENLQIADSFKSCIFETEPFNVKKTLKNSNQLAVSGNSKPDHEVYREIKFKPFKNYLTIVLILIFGLSQKIEAKTGKINPSYNSENNGAILKTPTKTDNKLIAPPTCATIAISISSQTNVSCNGFSNGAATISASGGNGINYSWSPSGGNSATAGGLAAGFYTCVATNNCGNSGSIQVHITQPSSITVTASVSAKNNVTCNGLSNGSATISASGGSGFTYSWSPGGGTNAIANGLSAGSYTCVVKNSCNNSATVSVNITQPSTISLNVSATSTICAGSSASLTASANGVPGPFTYTWMPGALIGANQTVSPSVNTTYTVTVNDANGCSASATQIVIVTSITASLSAKNNVTCNGLSNGSGTISASGGTGISYSWSPSGGTSSIANGLSVGSYTCVVKNSCNNSATVSVSITQPPAINLTAGANSTICLGSNASLSASASGGTGSFTYNWMPGNLAGASRTVSPSVNTTYTVTATDGIGCTSSATQVITVINPTITASILSQNNVTCNSLSNGSATINASGGSGLTYSWSPSGGISSIASGLSAGSYACVVKNSCNNSTTVSVNITQPSTISLIAGASSTILCSGNTASLSANASGGAGSFTYTWMPGSLVGANQIVTPSVTTVYTVTTKDANACAASAIQNVTVTNPTVTASVTKKNITCNDLSNGSATVTASGGTGLTYSWSPSGGTSSIANGLSPATYTCVIMNSCGNSATITQKITEPSAIVLIAGASSTILCIGDNASLSANATGGMGSFTYTWIPGNLIGANQTVSPSVNTIYTVTATDASGCTSSATQMVTVLNPTVTASISAQNNVSCYGLSNGSATISASGGSNFTYSWSPTGGTSSIASGLNAGTYTCVVKNSCNNSAIVIVSISERAPISLITGSSSTICSGATASLSANAHGGTGSLTYNWMPGNLIGATQIVSPTISKTYTITVTDSNNCISSATQMVIVSGFCPVSYVPCGNTYMNLKTYSTCQAINGAINYRFNFYNNITDDLVAVKTQTSNYIYFNTVAGLYYGKTYKWTVSVDNGAGFGPESNRQCTISFAPPLSFVPCGNSYANLNKYSTCQAVNGATNYRFSFYNNETNTLVAVKTQTSNYIYFNTVNGLNYNTTYKWTIEVQYNDAGTGNLVYGPASTNSCTIIFDAPQTTVPCGNSFENLNTYSSCLPILKAMGYRFSFYDNTTNALLAVKTQTSNYIYFNTVSGLNYGNTYKWTVEVQYKDENTQTLIYGPASSNDCTITFEAPQSIVPCGNSYTNLNSYTTCKAINKATGYRFSFYNSSTNELIAVKTQTSNYIYFNTVIGLHYNNTYNWTVEVQYKDVSNNILVYSPASSDSCTITFNAPQTTIPCGLTYAINNYSGIPKVYGASGYRWKFYDAISDSLIATKTNASPYIYFNTVSGLIFNKTYKWTVEVQYYNGTSYQFGPASPNTCTMNYGTPSALVIYGTNNNNNTAARISKQSTDNNVHEFSINLFPNPTKDKITVEASETINHIMVYNISGQLLLSLDSTNEIDLTNFKTGLYIVTIETEKNTSRFKIIKE